MEKLTIKDVARICNVSVSTVSRAINDSPDISSETREKILKVIKENYYVPNNNARNLKISELNTIAVLIKGIDNSFFWPIISTIEKEIQKRKYTFILHRVDQDEDEIDVAIALEKEKKLKGIIFLGGYFSHSKEKLSKLNIPFVLSTVGIKEVVDFELCGSVAVDDTKESEKIVDYLCKLGHKRIALVTSPPDDESIGTMRYEGYRNALKKNNVEFDEKLVIILDNEWNKYSMKNGYDATTKLLESGANPTAIFAIADSVAIGVCKAIIDKGLEIPDDISVAGFDGLELSNYYSPTLTTISQPCEEIAMETIRILFRIMDRKPIDVHKIFQGKLIVGDSTKRIDSKGK